MDIDRLRKLSGLNEKRPGDRGFTPGVQEPADRLKNDRKALRASEQDTKIPL